MVLDGPLDLVAVEADDALLDGLRGPVVVTDSELARVLCAWRCEVESGLPSVLVGVDEAVRVVRAASHRHRRTGRRVRSRVADVARVVFRLLGGQR